MRARPKPLEIPKKPKANSSNAVKENWIKRVKEIRAKNKKRLSDWTGEKSKHERLKKQVTDTRRSDKF